MTPLWLRFLTALSLCVAFVQTSPAQVAAPSAPAAAPSAMPVADFFRLPHVHSPALSPDGKRLAMLVPASKGRMGLAVADIATPDKWLGIAQLDDADVRSFHWVNSKRLVFDAIDFQSALGDQLGGGLYAVDADGSDFVWLVERTRIYRSLSLTAARALPWRHRLVRTIDGETDEVIVERFNYLEGDEAGSSTLLRLNTRTMATRLLYRGDVPRSALQWVVDRTDQPRALVSYDTRTTATVYWRAENSDDWVALTSFDIFDPKPGSFTPFAFDHEGRLYVEATQGNDERTSALYRYDTQKKALDGPPLVSLKGFDFEGQLVFDNRQRKLLGVHFLSDGPGSFWFDASMKATQEAVDKQLPGTVNRISFPQGSGTHAVVSATSDRQSPVYFLLDRANSKLRLLGATRPWLDASKMAERDFVRIKARDGMEFPVHVTKPKGKGPFPTVVMIHGGPQARGGAWEFERQSQFLASRGYLVVEPEFRGSTGFGERWFRAGWKQWGLKSQDDMTDATRWAIAQGLADPKRIAIAGGSYGGYATMMGLVKEPELYRAGINIVGVTDIELMYDIGWSDFMGSVWMRYGMPKLIGDPKQDAEQLKATSPLQQATRIKQPVLMAYGEEDLRVPLPHGTKMREALLKAGNRDVEWVQYPGEGHGFLLLKNQVDFWSRVERFLAKHLN